MTILEGLLKRMLEPKEVETTGRRRTLHSEELQIYSLL
jgi:hypothetical protein